MVDAALKRENKSNGHISVQGVAAPLGTGRPASTPPNHPAAQTVATNILHHLYVFFGIHFSYSAHQKFRHRI